MSDSFDRPYISFVATARNDDHGGNMLGRLQTFVNALIGQAKRHSVPVELVLVEWNPPAEKLPLAQVLKWPADALPCTVRVITVPPDVHQRYKQGNALPLYQMIGKNVGIRRARGEHILATNIDILFSDELMQFIADRRLEIGRMYRVDRYDVGSDVPADAPVEVQLEYCRKHLLRVNAREGTFGLTPDGQRLPNTPDIVATDSGIYLAAGWYAPEQYFGRLFRIASADAEMALETATFPRTLRMDLEPAAGKQVTLAATDSGGKELGTVQIKCRTSVRIDVSSGMTTLRIRVAGTAADSVQDTVSLRVFRCEWDRAYSEGPALRAEPAPGRLIPHAWQIMRSAGRFVTDLRTGRGTGRVGLPLSFRALDRFRLRPAGTSIDLRKNTAAAPPLRELPPDLLHTNACGDFTLMHRRHWVELHGYPEFDMYSMNLDSVLCYMAHYGGAEEQALSGPMRIYHIEHSSGSGWTPEGEELLYRRLAGKGIPFLPYEVVTQWASQMKTLGSTMIFNREDWGLGGEEFGETCPARPRP